MHLRTSNPICSRSEALRALRGRDGWARKAILNRRRLRTILQRSYDREYALRSGTQSLVGAIERISMTISPLEGKPGPRNADDRRLEHDYFERKPIRYPGQRSALAPAASRLAAARVSPKAHILAMTGICDYRRQPSTDAPSTGQGHHAVSGGAQRTALESWRHKFRRSSSENGFNTDPRSSRAPSWSITALDRASRRPLSYSLAKPA